jgi:hypothetical protein
MKVVSRIIIFLTSPQILTERPFSIYFCSVHKNTEITFLKDYDSFYILEECNVANCCCLNFDTVWFGWNVPTYQRNMLPQHRGWFIYTDDRTRKILRNIFQFPPNYMMTQPRKQKSSYLPHCYQMRKHKHTRLPFPAPCLSPTFPCLSPTVILSPCVTPFTFSSNLFQVIFYDSLK